MDLWNCIASRATKVRRYQKPCYDTSVPLAQVVGVFLVDSVQPVLCRYRQLLLPVFFRQLSVLAVRDENCREFNIRSWYAQHAKERLPSKEQLNGEIDMKGEREIIIGKIGNLFSPPEHNVPPFANMTTISLSTKAGTYHLKFRSKDDIVAESDEEKTRQDRANFRCLPQIETTFQQKSSL